MTPRKLKEKKAFLSALKAFAERMNTHVSAEDGEWTVKGFIDIYRNIYTISSDTKVISKILEIHLFPEISKFAQDEGYSIVLAEHQNWYPDLSFVNLKDTTIKFAVDLKTTYRSPDFPDHVNGFTLGSHGAYFKKRSSAKNIQFPYNDYSGHICLGMIYTRADSGAIDESTILRVDELDADAERAVETHPTSGTVENLRSITSVIKDLQFFVCEKWQLASDRQGSGNTANIGSITAIEDVVKGNGVFAKLGEDWFDEYWMNYGITTMKKGSEVKIIKRLEDFVDFKKGDKSLIVPVKSKKKRKATDESCPTSAQEPGH